MTIKIETDIMTQVINYIPEKIYIIADLHEGSKQFAEPQFRENLKEIQDDIDNGVVVAIITNGDLLETSIETPFLFGQICNINDQKEYMIEALEPFRKYIVGMNTGNHEYRILKKTNGALDLHRDLCYALKVKDTSSAIDNHDGSVFYFKNKRLSYSFLIKHELGNATAPSSKATQLLKMSNAVWNLDGYFLGHSHDHMVLPTTINKFDKNSKKTYTINVMYAYTGHHLKYGGYAFKKAYKPVGMPNFRKILLNKEFRQMKVL